MSNHSSNKRVDLHHNQVDAARARRLFREEDRIQSFLIQRGAILAQLARDYLSELFMSAAWVIGVIGITLANLAVLTS